MIQGNSPYGSPSTSPVLERKQAAQSEIQSNLTLKATSLLDAQLDPNTPKMTLKKKNVNRIDEKKIKSAQIIENKEKKESDESTSSSIFDKIASFSPRTKKKVVSAPTDSEIKERLELIENGINTIKKEIKELNNTNTFLREDSSPSGKLLFEYTDKYCSHWCSGMLNSEFKKQLIDIKKIYLKEELLEKKYVKKESISVHQQSQIDLIKKYYGQKLLEPFFKCLINKMPTIESGLKTLFTTINTEAYSKISDIKWELKILGIISFRLFASHVVKEFLAEGVEELAKIEKAYLIDKDKEKDKVKYNISAANEILQALFTFINTELVDIPDEIKAMFKPDNERLIK